MLNPRIEAVVREVMDVAKVPGMAVIVARGDGPPEQLVVGSDVEGRPIAPDSLFAVASITKMATALAVIRLADVGTLWLDDPLAEYLPAAAAAADPAVTLRSLLCHTSGLPLDVPPAAAPYAPGLDWPTLAVACLHTTLETPTGQQVRYSNTGYGLLALVVEQLTGQHFPEALQALVLQPLGVEGYLGGEPPRRPVVLADVRGGRSRPQELEPFNSPFYRSLGLPWAGLVTTADGALRIVQAFGGRPSGFLSGLLRAEAIRSQTGDLDGGFVPPLWWPRCPWGLGPELRGDKTPHWTPPEAGADSFGHSGGSGCLAWSSPSAGAAWAILGARTADSGWLFRRAPAIVAAILGG